MKKISLFVCSVLCICATVLLGACGKTETNDNIVTSASTPAKQSNFTSSVETRSDNEAEAVVYGEKKDDLTYVVISINPEILVGIDSAGQIKYVENLNADGADVLDALLSDTDDEKYENVEKFMNAYLTTVVDKGYGDKEDFTISIRSYDEGVQSADIVEQVTESIANAIPEDKIEAENVTFIVGDEQKEETWVECPDCSYGIAVCPYCNGKWENGEEQTCGGCGGTGTITITESRTILVYNGTPCRICDDVGTVDDGKHGGKRAICGECMGYGKSHSVGDEAPQEGGYNGVYAGYAFSEKEVIEEKAVKCNACDGMGKTTVPCTHCSYGEILCPTCHGKGGHFE